MATECSKRYVIGTQVRHYLWASSAGYCANPDCRINLFALVEGSQVAFGELAHIFAAGDTGPRANPDLGSKERAQPSNILLLCANCHTKVDKAPGSFTADIIIGWKRQHLAAISGLFQVPQFERRPEARVAVEKLFRQNRSVFERYGPRSEAGKLRFDEEPVLSWRRKVQEIILPNNAQLINIADVNSTLLRGDELDVLERFRNHVDDFEARHFRGVVEPGGEQFPTQIEGIFS